MSRENVIISMDGHTEAFLDLKPWLPNQHHAAWDAALEEGRKVFTGGNRYWADLVYAGTEFAWQSANELVEVDTTRYHQVMTCAERIANIDADGVAAEFLIDGFGPNTTDPTLQHEIAMAFCRWFKDYTSPAPYRFSGAVAVSLAAGIEVVVEEIHAAYAHGLRAIHLPPSPGTTVAAHLPQFNDGFYEPMWEALNHYGMAAIWHPSVGREKPLWRWAGTQPGWEALLLKDISELHHTTLKYLLLGGILERHPNMKIGYIESGSAWIKPILADLDRFFGGPTVNPAHRLTMKPSEQWARQGFSAGPLDRSEVAIRHEVGVENLMFGSDYIHTEGTWPTTRAHVARLMADVPEEERFAIVAGNAARLFGFDLDQLAHTRAAQTDWRSAAAQQLAA